MKRFIAYSLASCNALSEGRFIDRTLSLVSNDLHDFIVIILTETKIPLHQINQPPMGRVIWRGKNELAQNFRKVAA